MTAINIHEQIARLRRLKGMTQEELARALGVTNQAVSKWESAQCCPDIQLLPDMAALLGVSVDELLGTAAPEMPLQPEDMTAALRSIVDSLPKEQYIPAALRTVRALHAILLDKGISAMPELPPAWSSSKEEIIRQAAAGEWHFTAWNEPGITTMMRRGTVLFSDNQHVAQVDVRRIAAILRPLSDAHALKTAFALYELTEGSTKAAATLAELSKAAALSDDVVSDCLSGALAAFVYETNGAFRFDDEKMCLMPLLSLLDER